MSTSRLSVLTRSERRLRRRNPPGEVRKGAEPPSEEKSYRDVKHYKRRKRWRS